MIKLSLNLFVCRQAQQKHESISEYNSDSNSGNILATLPGRTLILKSMRCYLLSREAEMVRIGTKEIVSGAVCTRGFAVKETSGDRKQSDAYGRTLQYWVL